MVTKVKRPNGRQVREERAKIETFQEFYVEDMAAVHELVNLFAINAKTFDYKQFIAAVEEEKSKKAAK
jgi:hypothetical protein